jgi:hypothetical protein
LVESSSEEEQEDDDEDEEKEYDEEEMTLFIKNFSKYMIKRRHFKGVKERTRSKKCVTIVERVDTSLLNVHMKEKKMMMTRKRRRRRATRKKKSS